MCLIVNVFKVICHFDTHSGLMMHSLPGDWDVSVMHLNPLSINQEVTFLCEMAIKTPVDCVILLTLRVTGSVALLRSNISFPTLKRTTLVLFNPRTSITLKYRWTGSVVMLPRTNCNEFIPATVWGFFFILLPYKIGMYSPVLEKTF